MVAGSFSSLDVRSNLRVCSRSISCQHTTCGPSTICSALGSITRMDQLCRGCAVRTTPKAMMTRRPKASHCITRRRAGGAAVHTRATCFSSAARASSSRLRAPAFCVAMKTRSWLLNPPACCTAPAPAAHIRAGQHEQQAPPDAGAHWRTPHANKHAHAQGHHHAQTCTRTRRRALRTRHTPRTPHTSGLPYP